MKTLAEINAEAKNYSPDCEALQDAFVAGARWMASGRYYKPAELFSEPQPVDLEVQETEPIVRLKDGLIPTFDEFWNAYDYKKGRKKAEEKWNRLKPFEKIACMKAVPKYVASTIKAGEPQDHKNYKPYRAHPLTYLNGARWEDEIEEHVNYEQQRTISLASKAARILSGANNPG